MATNPYVESDEVKKAQEMLNQQLSQKPGEYQSSWQTQLNDTINKILNREKFSYDLNGDMLYQQYKDQYTTQGKMAMMDTMGQAQAMTGGYGNSYAQTAGQQSYNNHLQQLNDKVPELYQLALNKYAQEGQDLYNQYSLLGSQEEQDYNRYQDSLANWQTEMDRLQNQYNSEREFDYGKYADDRNYQYQVGRDQVADEQWQKEFDEAKRQYDQNYALTAGKTTTGSSGSSGGSGGSGGSGYNNGGYSADVVKQAQAFVGATADGKWGSNSSAAAKAKGYNSIAEVVAAMGNGNNNNNGGGTKLTYSDVATTAAQMKQKGVSKNDIYQYISSVVNSPNYVPTTSVSQDLAELKSGYVGSGR